MNVKIVIVGSTGKLGTKLLNYTSKLNSYLLHNMFSKLKN